MLKVVFTIDCDSCREPLETAAVCCDFENLVWQSFAWDLTVYAQQRGWDFDEDRQRFVCDRCLEREDERNPVLAINGALEVDQQEAIL